MPRVPGSARVNIPFLLGAQLDGAEGILLGAARADRPAHEAEELNRHDVLKVVIDCSHMITAPNTSPAPPPPQMGTAAAPRTFAEAST